MLPGRPSTHRGKGGQVCQWDRAFPSDPRPGLAAEHDCLKLQVGAARVGPAKASWHFRLVGRVFRGMILASCALAQTVCTVQERHGVLKDSETSSAAEVRTRTEAEHYQIHLL